MNVDINLLFKKFHNLLNLLAAFISITILVASQWGYLTEEKNWIWAMGILNRLWIGSWILLIFYFINNIFSFITRKKLIFIAIFSYLLIFLLEGVVPSQENTLKSIITNKIEACGFEDRANSNISSSNIIQMLNSKELNYVYLETIKFKIATFSAPSKSINLIIYKPFNVSSCPTFLIEKIK